MLRTFKNNHALTGTGSSGLNIEALFSGLGKGGVHVDHVTKNHKCQNIVPRSESDLRSCEVT